VGREHWLSAIARNVCLRWTRGRGQELSRLVAWSRDDTPVGSTWEDGPADAFEVEVELERAELAELLDRAMALLPPATRAVLVERYIHDAPQAEVAVRLGMSEGAVAVTVHRGKLALRRLLTTELGTEAAVYGLGRSGADEWQKTHMWCPYCGQRRVHGYLDPANGRLQLRCPRCDEQDLLVDATLPEAFKDIKGYKPAFSRLLAWIHAQFRERAEDGVLPCPSCGRPLPVRKGVPAWAPDWSDGADSIYFWCPTCMVCDRESLGSLALSLPEVRRFWREQPRMHQLPQREIEADGQPAVATGFESVTGRARIDVVVAQRTFDVIELYSTCRG
jgi:RNA polymerase sigma factor (sigma-70 family)